MPHQPPREGESRRVERKIETSNLKTTPTPCWLPTNLIKANPPHFQRVNNGHVGDGTRVKFWHDVWCGDYPLKEAFSEFYCISRSREASLGCTILVNWELESLALFKDLIYSTSVQGDNCDKSVRSRLRVEVLRFVDIIILHYLLMSC